jgi:Fic family protein
MVASVIKKSEFWKHYNTTIMNTNQREILNRVLDGFLGNMTSGKVSKFLHVSQDTATRLLQDLVNQNIMEKQGDGRNTHYILKEFSYKKD